MRISAMMRFVTGAMLVTLGLSVPVLAQETAPAVNDQPVLTVPAADENTPNRPRKPRLTLKPTAGFFFPTNAKTRSTFGSSWTMIGLTLDYRDEDRSKSRFQFQIDGFNRKSFGDHASIFQIGAKYTQRLNNSRHFSPYFGGGAGWCVASVKSVADGVDTGLRSAGVGGNAFVGANLGMNIKVEASYHAFPNVKGFNLSGFSVGMQWQF